VAAAALAAAGLQLFSAAGKAAEARLTRLGYRRWHL